LDKRASEYLALGLAARDSQYMEEARVAIAAAAKLAPHDAKMAFAHAQINFETWRPAAKLFRDAQRLAPQDLHITRNAALALAAEGEVQTAQKLLLRALNDHPSWVDGHTTLATLRITSGARDSFDQSFGEACAKQPHDMPLRLAWFHTLSKAREWDAARRVIFDGEQLLGPQRALEVARIYIASESDEASTNPHLFDSVEDMCDPGLDLCHVRYCLRLGRIDKAISIASRHISSPAASIFWPYLSLAWRLQGNANAAWLDGDPLLFQCFDLDFSVEELEDLTQTLRALHVMQAPYLEQSVRGGTQTDRQLFFHHDPVIQKAKARIQAAVRDYVAQLPPCDAAHPLLGAPRGEQLFEGSWSVRLGAQGYHSCHTHSRGWISSAFYVSLPAPEQMGPSPAGWLQFGTPPPELGLPLDVYTQIEPKPGRLVLFPSTLWHGTVPFNDGERLSIAFDIRRPRS
jgi:Tfp pilus assembly protein PilF